MSDTDFDNLQELEKIRDKVTSYIESKLKDKKLASHLEKALYEYTMKRTSLNEVKMFKYQIFQQRYNYDLGYLVLNIKQLEEKVVSGEITYADIFNKDPFILFPDKWEESKKRKSQEDKFLYESKLISNCDKWCNECKTQNVYFKSAQTRSADEPETIFYTCLSCSNNWKC